MTALENVMTGRHLRERRSLLAAMLRTPRAGARRGLVPRCRARGCCERVGLADYRDARADAMPYGALKRLEIARALAAEPLLLLLDEPAAGLNQTEAREIDALIKRLAAEGMTVILVEHNMRLVMGVSDQRAGARPRQEARRGHAGADRSRPARDRGLPRRGRRRRRGGHA